MLSNLFILVAILVATWFGSYIILESPIKPITVLRNNIRLYKGDAENGHYASGLLASIAMAVVYFALAIAGMIISSSLIVWLN